MSEVTVGAIAGAVPTVGGEASLDGLVTLAIACVVIVAAVNILLAIQKREKARREDV